MTHNRKDKQSGNYVAGFFPARKPNFTVWNTHLKVEVTSDRFAASECSLVGKVTGSALGVGSNPIEVKFFFWRLATTLAIL